MDQNYKHHTLLTQVVSSSEPYISKMSQSVNSKMMSCCSKIKGVSKLKLNDEHKEYLKGIVDENSFSNLVLSLCMMS